MMQDEFQTLLWGALRLSVMGPCSSTVLPGYQHIGYRTLF